MIGLVDPNMFGHYLKEKRKENGLTIRQLEEKSGVSNAYLSQIENGKKGIPSPEILKKLYEPLEVSYDELMEKAGYISPRLWKSLHPETKNTIESHGELTELLSNAADLFISSVTDKDGLLEDRYKDLILRDISENYSTKEADTIRELAESKSFLNSLFENLSFEEKIKFLNFIINDFADRNIDPKEVFGSPSFNLDSEKVPTLHVPVLGYIAAGQPIFADEHIDEWMEIPNLWSLKQGEAIVLKVKGDSMTGSRIYDGDKVIVKIQPDVENGEIAVVNVNGDEATLKKVKKTESGQVILYPDNPRYEPIFISNESARIIGKVVQVMFEPK